MSASRALSSGGIKVELNDLLNVFMKKKKKKCGGAGILFRGLFP